MGEEVLGITGVPLLLGVDAIDSRDSLLNTVCLMILATRVRVIVFTNAARLFFPSGVGLSSSQSSGPKTFSNAPAAQTCMQLRSKSLIRVLFDFRCRMVTLLGQTSSPGMFLQLRTRTES